MGFLEVLTQTSLGVGVVFCLDMNLIATPRVPRLPVFFLILAIGVREEQSAKTHDLVFIHHFIKKTKKKTL